MIDLHCHILPAVDDGAADLDDALAMCRLAAEDGCTAIVATPHLRHEFWRNRDRQRLEREWRRIRGLMDGIIDIHLGGEIAVNSESCSEMSRLPASDLLSLAGSRYLLLELHPGAMGPDPEELIHELIVSGWWPVIAHPERIPWLAGDPGYLRALLDLGALSQVTAMSVCGRAGRFAFDCTRRMLDTGMVHFIASDAHDTAIRPPGLSLAYRHVAGAMGEPVARRLLITNPRAVLENRPLSEGRGAKALTATSAPRRESPASRGESPVAPKGTAHRGRWRQATPFRASVLLVAALVALASSHMAEAADAFYDRLLQDGVRAYGDGDYPLAANSLRLACFGLLDEPIVLARGLTYLALAHAASGDQAAFTGTFDRILEIERRFQAFSRLELDTDSRQVFEAHLHRWIALDVLERESVFHRAARLKQIFELAPAERRLELERLVTAEPEGSTWRLLLAELMLDSDQFEAALAATAEVLARHPRLGRALCLRARANAAIGKCEPMAADLDSCHRFAGALVVAEAKLRCYVRQQDWRRASAVLNEVPAGDRHKAPFRQLGREVKKGLKTTTDAESGH